MIDLYDQEVEKIYSTVQTVQNKYWGKEANGSNLLELQQELIGRLADLGFGAIVDVTPILEGQPANVSINKRLNGEFDPERKRWEVKERAEKRKENPDGKIKGVV